MPTYPHAQQPGVSSRFRKASPSSEQRRRLARRALAALVLVAGMAAGLTGCAQANTTSTGSTSIAASDLDHTASGNKSPSGSGNAAASSTSGASASGHQFVVPDAAKAHTKEGAVAFVTFYWNMLGELNAHPQTGVIPKFATDNCKACQRQEREVEALIREGAHFQDPGAILMNGAVRSDSTQDSVVVQFRQTSKGSEKFIGGKRIETQAPVNDRIELRADWTGTEWKLGEEGHLAQ